ncbi:MAG: methyltransferase domain-containing protein, partial [Solirubrobacterales bacterium]|nr:methyltransferase domain-containing protein [Solirubrobacterales bacterium]
MRGRFGDRRRSDGHGPAPCRVCGGRLAPHLRGRGVELGPAALAPSFHEPGRHGDLVTCVECGAVEQTGLPRGRALRDAYVAVEDDAYLADEPGRRATAARLLDLIAAHVPAGRLLDVGCGHGLLLDEARRRGYDAAGLELSRAAAAHARGVLGLEVHQVALEEFAGAADETFDVVVLADVLEHVDDPVAAIDACLGLLRDGGALCVTTPDPASATARLAGRRWWGYLPAHVVLLPRRTLRELLGARGLVVCEDVPLVRTFPVRRWAGGLAERLGPLGPPLQALAGRLGEDRSFSLSLGDERVVLARRVPVRQAPEPLFEERGHRSRVHIVLPAFHARATIPSVVRELPPRSADRALLVDDASTDATTVAALAGGLDVLRHPVNLGYGAAQKSGYVRALLDGADVLVMVHADDQYDPGLLREMTAPILAGEADVVIGSRLLEDHTAEGGMPRWKWVGNRALTAVENRVLGAHLSEYHSGYRAFSADLLRSIPFLRNADGFVFDQQILAQAAARGARVAEVAIPTRYFEEASSIGLRTSIAYGVRTLGALTRFALDRRGVRWALLRRPAADLAPAPARAAPAAA